MCKIEAIGEIMKMIHTEKPEMNSNRMRKVQERLNQATEEEVLRLYDAFSRFGIDAIFEAVK